jgi:hypothetical protein
VYKTEWSIACLSSKIIFSFAIVLTIFLAGLSIFSTRFLSKDNLPKCIAIEQADNSFLSSYIGYFLIGLSVDTIQELMVVWVLIVILLYIARFQYFNAIYMIFGYHYYHATTEKGTRVFIICRKEIRNPENISFNNLRRVNDSTYIERRD